MVTIANEWPATIVDLPLPDHTRLGMSVRDLMTLPCLAGTTVIAGASGIDRVVRRVNVMEVPDILPWVKPAELLLTTGYPLRHSGDPAESPAGVAALVRLITELDARELAAVAIKLGRYLDEVPAPVRRVADRLGLPLLRLPDGVAFDEVLSGVFTALLDRQSRALTRTDALHRALAAIVLEGGDLPQIADEVARLLDAAVLICTPDGRVQARGGRDELQAAFAALDRFDDTGRFRVEQVGAGGRAPAGEHWPGELAMVSIVAGGTDHGRIAAYRPSGALPPPGVQGLERAATVAALAITKQLAVSAVESKFRGDYLRDVLDGSAGDAEAVVEHCRSLDWDVDRPLVVVVAELNPDEPGQPAPPTALRSPHERFTAAWQQVVRTRDKAAPVVGFRQEVVALLPVESVSRESARQVVGETVAAVTGDRGGGRRSFCAGVSRVVTDAGELAEAYSAARKALAVGRRVGGRGSVSHFDDLGVYRLLSLVPDPGELRLFAGETLGELARDTSEARDLRKTLQTLLDTNLNVAETARELHFHYNTLRYRITKLERLVGPFTSDAHLRLNVSLALQVMEMRGIVAP
ncbi:MAG: PucR family transcriptional regulator ligand-binding domain-containing protein [Actinobacteria bacterium]|nr:PucR family transcriptional regulator ligand-binding domain-containing protein [Actinomycetota bacterium]